MSCKNCKWWAANRPNSRASDSMRALGPFGCDKARQFRNDDDFMVEPGNGFISDEGIGVLTGPDFGCIHWEARESG